MISEVRLRKTLSIDTVLEKTENVKEKPSIIIAHTVKGKGISFMENTAK